MNTEAQKHLFASYPDTDIFYTTSNGWAFAREDDAIEAAKLHKLDDKSIGTLERSKVMGKGKAVAVEATEPEEMESAPEGDEHVEAPKVVSKGKKK